MPTLFVDVGEHDCLQVAAVDEVDRLGVGARDDALVGVAENTGLGSKMDCFAVATMSVSVMTPASPIVKDRE